MAAAVYHINPKTGEPGVCKAEIRCRYGEAQHYETEAAARQAYEKSQSLDLSGVTGIAPTRGQASEDTYTFSDERLAEAILKIDKANRKLKRAGLPGEFTYSYETVHRKTGKRAGGVELMEPRVEFTVQSPTVTIEGNEFLAVVERAEEGLVVKTARGVDLQGYQPTDLRCDHCGKAMNRQKTYLAKDAEGKLLHLGSACVKGYLGGVKPEGLWLLEYEPLGDMEDAPISNEPGLSGKNLARPTVNMLAYGLAVSNGGADFMSRSRAADFDKPATADLVESALFGTNREWSEEIQKKADEYIASGEAAALLERFRKEADPNTDFGRNMGVITTGDYVKGQHMSILLGGLGRVGAEKRKQAKVDSEESQFGKAASGYAGYVGEKLAGRKAKVRDVKHFDSTDYYGEPITKTRLSLRDEEGHEMVWWASKKIELEAGKEIAISGGTVKDHKEYQGVDQTILTRLKYVETPPAE